MKNLLKAELMRLKKSKHMLVINLMMIVIISLVSLYMFTNGFEKAWSSFDITIPFDVCCSGILFFAFINLCNVADFFSVEFENDVLKILIASGVERARYYISKLLFSMIFTFLLFLTYLVTVYLFGILYNKAPVFSPSSQDLLLVGIKCGSLLMWLTALNVMTIFIVFLSFYSQKAILYSVLCFVLNGVFVTQIDLTKNNILAFLLKHSIVYHLMMIETYTFHFFILKMFSIMAVPIMIVVGFTLLGISILNKRDL